VPEPVEGGPVSTEPPAGPDDQASLPDDEVAPPDSLPATASEAAKEESTGGFTALVISGLTFIVVGWLLPWFVEQTSNGIGFSAQDAVSSPPTGIGTVVVYLIGLAMLGLVAFALYDLFRSVAHRGRPLAMWRLRASLAILGAVGTLVVWLLIGVLREEPLFGNISSFAATDNAVWMTLTGFIVLALVYGFRPWVVTHGEIAFGGVVFMIGALFPFIFNQSISFIEWGASAAAIYTLLALGLNVVVGFAGLLDLGYAAFFAIGAYTCGSLASPVHGLHFPFWIVMFIGLAVAALFGAMLGAPTLRLRGDYLAIVTLGFGEIIPDAANNNLFNATGGPEGITGIDHPSIFGFNFGIDAKFYFWSLLIIIAVVLVLLRNIQRSRLGRAWAAIREDEVAAAATGVNPVTTKLLAFAIGASVSGLAGAFFGAELGSVTPDSFQFAVSVTVLSTVVLGGLGNNTGVAVGGILVSFIIFWMLDHLQEWMGTFGTKFGISALGTIDYSRWVYIVYGAILVGIMLLRPAGLLPSKARKSELQAGGQAEALATVQGRA
jgi:branched-chain amino acid transport system permease protein